MQTNNLNDIETLKAQILRLETERVDVNKSLSLSTNENNFQKSQINEYENSINNLKKDYEFKFNSMQNEICSLKEQLREKSENSINLLHLNKENQTQIKKYQDKVQALLKENKKMKNQLKLEKDEFEEINSSFDVMENQLLEGNKTNKILKETIDRLNFEINNLKEDIKKINSKRNNEGEIFLF